MLRRKKKSYFLDTFFCKHKLYLAKTVRGSHSLGDGRKVEKSGTQLSYFLEPCLLTEVFQPRVIVQRRKAATAAAAAAAD